MYVYSHRKKRENKIKKEIKRGIREANAEDAFELFVSLNNIRYVYYKETDKILGNTYGMCILQDFEAITPNLLARTIETVEGGGLVILLLKGMSSLKQLCKCVAGSQRRQGQKAYEVKTPCRWMYTPVFGPRPITTWYRASTSASSSRWVAASLVSSSTTSSTCCL